MVGMLGSVDRVPRAASSAVNRRRRSTVIRGMSLLLVLGSVSAFQILPNRFSHRISSLNIYAPPGSGYAGREDESSVLPDSYEPMMEYPGTMRPGRTPENVPFQDLPIGDKDPDPVPWPHFQQIEWHHRWDPPHEHPIPMEEYIELNGRWATPEMEAAMRAGVRRDVRERREKEEADQREMIITDDDEDDDIPTEPVALGDGIFGKLGSDDDRAATAAATAPPVPGETATPAPAESDTDDDLDDFLLDLGLDAELDQDVEETTTGKKEEPEPEVDLGLELGLDDEPDEEEEESVTMSNSGTTATINVDDDADIGFGLDDDDEIGDGVDTVPLEDFGDSDTIDTEDIFDEGGFDFDDDYGGDFDGGDMW